MSTVPSRLKSPGRPSEISTSVDTLQAGIVYWKALSRFELDVGGMRDRRAEMPARSQLVHLGVIEDAVVRHGDARRLRASPCD